MDWKITQHAAERLHVETGAPLTICIAADLRRAEIVIGAWCPSERVVSMILRSIVDRIDSGRGKIIDLTNPGGGT